MSRVYVSMERQELIKKLIDDGFISCDEEGNIYTHRTGGYSGPTSLKSPRKLTQYPREGYLRTKVVTDNRNKPKVISSHHIIWINFNGFIPEDLQVNHIDLDKSNNRLSNLELMTPLENTHHFLENGDSSMIIHSGEDHVNSKLTWKQVRGIRKDYIRGSVEKGQVALAKKHNVTQATLSAVLLNKTWKSDNNSNKGSSSSNNNNNNDSKTATNYYVYDGMVW